MSECIYEPGDCSHHRMQITRLSGGQALGPCIEISTKDTVPGLVRLTAHETRHLFLLLNELLDDGSFAQRKLQGFCSEGLS